MRCRDIEVCSAATEVQQHIKTCEATPSTMLSIPPDVSSKTIQTHAVASLNVLSNELLFVVAEHLFDEAQDRFEDDELPPTTSSSRYCDYPYSNQYQAEILRYDPVLQDASGTSVTALKNMASTSRRLRDIAQPALYKGPILSIGRPCGWSQQSPIYLFARTMLENPRLRRLVTRLRIDIPSRWEDSMASPVGEPLEVCRMAVTFIDTQKWMVHDDRTGWKWQLQHLRAGPFCAVILSLLPNLTELSISSGSGSVENIFLTLFWSSSTTFRSTSKSESALRSLVRCPGLSNLRHFRTDSIASVSKPPLKDITTLTSLHLVPRRFEQLEHIGSLSRIKTLRLACNTDHTLLQPQLSTVPPSQLSYSTETLSMLLASLQRLEVLELYTGADLFERSGHSVSAPRSYIRSQRYTSLVRQCEIAASTLKSLEIPRGWWTLPEIDPSVPSHIDTCNAMQPAPLVHSNSLVNEQFGAYTGSIADFSLFACLETLIVHSTAIIAKGSYATDVADPTLTLPSPIKDITVYGAHDELWPWIGNILDHRGSHFLHLGTIILLRAEPVPGLDLSRLRDLKLTHEDLWRKIQGSSIALRGDV